eukprot:3375503-Prorocentrum_lima.AAC.1
MPSGADWLPASGTFALTPHHPPATPQPTHPPPQRNQSPSAATPASSLSGHPLQPRLCSQQAGLATPVTVQWPLGVFFLWGDPKQGAEMG